MSFIQRVFFNSSKATLEALGNSFALIEFKPDGSIVAANKTFCDAVGYRLEDIVGKHHSMFVDPIAASGPEYRNFWARLGRGEFDSGEYKRIASGGRVVWLQASYTPVLGPNGKVCKVVKLALDITEAKVKSADDAGKLRALARSQAVIEFDTSGKILTANENFLATVGYSLDEVVGRQHAMFVEPAQAAAPEYREFWDRLRRGEFVADEFRRLGRGGREIWLQATYNPITDSDGQVFKVVKFATDVTERVNAVTAVATALSHLSGGDLQFRLEQKLIPSLDKLRVDFNAAGDKLQDLIRSVTGKVHGMRAATGEITQAADDLSKRTEQQAATLEETAAALDEITATVRKTAEGASQASSVVSGAKTDAEHSGQVVRDAVAAMTEIAGSAQQISQIIGVIDEIAFQTNLLALNAGVEAARAGDAGRGFAVVASEVRALAQRSAEAAKEIKTLISASTQQVGQGVQLVDQTGEALIRIVGRVGEIATLVTDIAASAQEQATGLSQVNTAVNQMDQVTQQNAAMVEQSTAASHSLAQEADELARLAARFKTGEEAPAAHAPRRPAAPPPRRAAAQLKTVSQVRPAEDNGWEEF